MKKDYSRFRTVNNDWEEKCFKERKDFIIYVCENDGIYICDSRFRLSTVRCKCLGIITSKKWVEVYNFLEMRGLLKCQNTTS